MRATRHMVWLILLLPLAAWWLLVNLEDAAEATASTIQADEELLFFPVCGYRDPDSWKWVISVHGWIFEPELDSTWRDTAINTLGKALGLTLEITRSEIFEPRARMFLVDNERGKSIEFVMGTKRFKANPSGPNGHFHKEISLDGPGGKRAVFSSQRHGDNRIFEGEIYLLEPEGLSIISDLDDTIKISEVHDKKRLVANTFNEPFRPVPGMAELYWQWAARGAAFHYLSASPWQLYPALAEFRREAQFPEGSFHLKPIRLKDETFLDLFQSPEAFKLPLIETLLKNYPARRFILIGDSGEKDPEVYATAARKFPDRIEQILIRKVPGAPDERDWESVFKGIPAERWRVFEKAGEVRSE